LQPKWLICGSSVGREMLAHEPAILDLRRRLVQNRDLRHIKRATTDADSLVSYVHQAPCIMWVGEWVSEYVSLTMLGNRLQKFVQARERNDAMCSDGIPNQWTLPKPSGSEEMNASNKAIEKDLATAHKSQASMQYVLVAGL
jgi:hypothetical protein